MKNGSLRWYRLLAVQEAAYVKILVGVLVM